MITVDLAVALPILVFGTMLVFGLGWLLGYHADRTPERP